MSKVVNLVVWNICRLVTKTLLHNILEFHYFGMKILFTHLYSNTDLFYLQKAGYINLSIYLYFRKAEIALQSFPQKVASRFVDLLLFSLAG